MNTGNARWQPYVTVDGRRLRRGYTTGTCAAAAAMAAAMLLHGDDPGGCITLTTLSGVTLTVPLASRETGPGWATCGVIKDGGDDPDVTHGLLICATVRESEVSGVVIKGGKGVGTVTKPGLATSPGEPAINPGPRQAIREAVLGVLPPGKGVVVEVSVPDGERVAPRTFNPRLGIVGGISILGSSGIVEPMSEEAFKNALEPQLRVARAAGFQTAVLVPGRRGERAAVDRFGFPAGAVVQMSNFVGFMLCAAVHVGFRKIILFGHHGKLVKVAGGVFNTHSRLADARLETMAAHAARLGASPDTVAAVLASNTAEDALGVLRQARLMGVFKALASQASRRSMEYVRRYVDQAPDVEVGTVMLSLEGELLAADENGVRLSKDLGVLMMWSAGNKKE